jgi:hypothetical protein
MKPETILLLLTCAAILISTAVWIYLTGTD